MSVTGLWGVAGSGARAVPCGPVCREPELAHPVHGVALLLVVVPMGAAGAWVVAGQVLGGRVMAHEWTGAVFGCLCH